MTRSTAPGVTSAARTAKPSIAVRSNGGRSIAACASAAITRRCASGSATSRLSSGSIPSTTRASASSRSFIRRSGHRARGLHEALVVDVVLELLLPHRVAHDLLELRIGRAGAQRTAQVGLGHREQAGAQLALGGDADPVAVTAERLAHRGDEPDRALPVGELPAPRRAVTLAPQLLQRVRGVDQPPHLGVGQHAVPGPRAVGVQRHELDEADLVRVLARELREAHDLVLGEVLQRHHVDLDRAQLRVPLRRREAVQHLLERVAARELEEAVRGQRVQRDVHAAQAGAHKLLDLALEQVAVGGQREVVDVLVGAQSSTSRHSSRRASGSPPVRRTSCTPMLASSADHPRDLLVGEDLVALQPRQALGGHAVLAAEVAAVGDRDAHVADRAAVPVVEGLAFHRW